MTSVRRRRARELRVAWVSGSKVNGYSIRLRSGALPAPTVIAFSNLWVGNDFIVARAIAKLLNIRYGG